MTTLRQAAQQALEAMQSVNHVNYSWACVEAITALRAALAEPEQEPVACPYCHNSATLGAVYFDQNCAGCVKRMTAPPQRKPLTDEELCKVFPAIATYTEANKTLYRSIARAIERAHGIGEQI